MNFTRSAPWTFAVWLSAVAASAAPTTYRLAGVTFDDGGVASGTFTFDPATGLYSNVDIRTTTGAARTGANYMLVCGQDVPSCNGLAPNSSEVLNLTSAAVDQTGRPGFALIFSQPLGSADAIDVAFGEEATCADAPCSATAPPLRFVTVGSVQAVVAPYQISYASNLNYGDATVIITNTGASAGALNPLTQAENGNLCANVYAFSADEQMIACCACHVTPNALRSLSVRNDLISNTLTPTKPDSVVIKLVASLAGTNGASGPGTVTSPTCNAATVTGAGFATRTANAIANGLVAWRSSVQVSGPLTGLTETPFSQSVLSVSELSRLTNLCGFIQSQGLNYGVCGPCRQGGLEAARQ